MAVAALIALAAATANAQVGTAFNYQGQLLNAGQPVDGLIDVRFTLFGQLTGGSPVAAAVTTSNVQASQGLFATNVDFGVNPYTSNQAMFLLIEVRSPAGSGSFVPLSTRQPLTPAPFSLATRGLNVDASGNLSLTRDSNRVISVATEPVGIPGGSNGKSLTVAAGSAASGFFASLGGNLVLQAGSSFNTTQPNVPGGDTVIRSGANLLSATDGRNGGSVILQTGAQNSTFVERLRITPSGNVGVGTAAPTALLDVSRATFATSNNPIAVFQTRHCGAPCGEENYTEVVRLVNNSNFAQSGMGFMVEFNPTINSEPDVWIGTGFEVDAGDQSNDFIIATKTNPTTLTNRLRVNGDNGNVGIGTDAPQARLHNIGITRTDGELQFGAQTWTGTTGTNAKFYRFPGNPTTGSNLYLDLSSQDGSSFIIQRNGQDRIMLNNDGSALKIGGGAWGVLSDQRTKNDIQTLTGTLDRLLQLKGHAYTYKSEFVEAGRALPGVQIGLVAQEVETIFPDWVSTGADGLKVVTERSTTALMVEALRDLRTEKDDQIEMLKARLEKLESLLAAQTGQVGK
ncbi:MAG: tail fiber domain-containing protein [Planctomycetota bacterium]|nr:tail fiber domain-containing protein [Planctomycetota bacterium]